MLSIMKLRFLRLRDDYLVILIMTAMALGLTAIFGMSFNSDYRPQIIIVDQDESKYSDILISELNRNSTFQYKVTDYEEAIELVDAGKALTAVVFNSDFGKSIELGELPKIELFKIKEDRGIFILENLIATFSNKMITNTRIAKVTVDYIADIKEVNRDDIENRVYLKAEEAWRYSKPVEAEKHMIDVNNRGNYDHLKHTMIGFSIFFSTYTIVFSIGTILNDRQYNTWQRILISPVSKVSLLGGSLISAYVVGVIQLGMLILGGKYLFGIDWGSSILGIILLAASFVFTITCFGLLLSGIVKTHAQLAAITPVVLTSTAMLGGCMWPLEIIKFKALLAISNFVPHKWAVEGMEKIAMYGYGLEAAIFPSLILIGMGIIFFAAGVRLVRFE